MNIEHAQNLIEHLPVLRRHADADIERSVRPQVVNERAKLDGFRPRSEYEQEPSHPGGRSLLVTVSNAALGEIVGREFEGYAIAGEHADAVAAQFTRKVREYNALLIELHAELACWKFLNDGSGYFNAVFFTHLPLIGIM
jgi:hypothetical protein